jgi:hypothetical protein
MQDKATLDQALNQKVAEIERFIANELGMGPVEDMKEAERVAFREDVDDLIDVHEQAIVDGDTNKEWTLRERQITHAALGRLLAERHEIEQKFFDALDEEEENDQEED